MLWCRNSPCRAHSGWQTGSPLGRGRGIVVSARIAHHPARLAMSDRLGLLQAILEAPDDDAPRLVYADWLEDHGDPEWAEFIRAQIAYARLDEQGPLWFDLLQKAGAIEQRREAEWVGEAK